MIAIKSLNSQDFSSIVIERNKSISYGSFALSIHMLRPFNTIIRYSSLIRLYDCVLLCLFNCHFVGEQLIFFYFVSCQLFKYVFFSPFISDFVCMCPGTCSNSSWQYHLTCAMTFDPTHFAMVTISFLFPLPSPPLPSPSLLPAHILVLCLSSDSPE